MNMANAEQGAALEEVVVGVVERAITALVSIGMERENALRLLTIQATIRMKDTEETRRLEAALGILDDGRGGSSI
jgi:hypothetical protein